MERIELARTIAKEAGNLTLRYFNDPTLEVERKNDGTPVTIADKGAEELLRFRIAEMFPEDTILGEEYPEKEGDSGWRWILDPIDGTKSFIHGVPLYSTLIGIEHEGNPVAGIIWIPPLGEGIWAQRGEGAWAIHPKLQKPVEAHVSDVRDLADALFLTSEVITFDQVGRRPLYNEVERRCRLTRTWGDAYGYYLVATGRADIMIDPDLSDWDAGPLLTVMQEAGGCFTDWRGVATISGKEGVATNALLFDQTIELTRRFPKRIRDI
ncbi:MAG: histidinol-phosphatase [Planctomycetia bacterium]|nr:histidinol-phosphatase [Planctomycetia bacterium]